MIQLKEQNDHWPLERVMKELILRQKGEDEKNEIFQHTIYDHRIEVAKIVETRSVFVLDRLLEFWKFRSKFGYFGDFYC